MNSISNILVFLFSIFLSYFVNPDKEKLAADYIDLHKNLAIAEMHRTGIPASITLAQALHESNYGTSKLATQANNHFGIKCKKDWQGDTFGHKDDDFDRKGKLIKSCFRAYPNYRASFLDHSEFLKNSSNYISLFKLHKTDYINWAHGLKKCGYATDPDYAIKLIKKIEKYDLSRFDFWDGPVKIN